MVARLSWSHSGLLFEDVVSRSCAGIESLLLLAALLSFSSLFVCLEPRIVMGMIRSALLSVLLEPSGPTLLLVFEQTERW